MSDDAKTYRKLVSEMDTAFAVMAIAANEWNTHNTLTTRSQYTIARKEWGIADKSVRVHVSEYGLPNVEDRKIRDE